MIGARGANTLLVSLSLLWPYLSPPPPFYDLLSVSPFVRLYPYIYNISSSPSSQPMEHGREQLFLSFLCSAVDFRSSLPSVRSVVVSPPLCCRQQQHIFCLSNTHPTFTLSLSLLPRFCHHRHRPFLLLLFSPRERESACSACSDSAGPSSAALQLRAIGGEVIEVQPIKGKTIGLVSSVSPLEVSSAAGDGCFEKLV